MNDEIRSGRLTTVEIATNRDQSGWDATAARLEGGSFYHRFAWKFVNEQAFGHSSIYLIARRDGGIAGILPLTLVSTRLFGTILCSVPFVNYGGPCAETADVADSLIEQAKWCVRDSRADRLELRCTREFPVGVQPSVRKVSMVVPLEPDPDRLWSTFTPKHRNNVRRSQKGGLVVESGRLELLDDFYFVMERAWRDLGTPLYERGYFERILVAFPEETRIFVCRHEGRPVAAALNGYCSGTVEGLWNGSVGEARNLYANYALYWEMIRDACVGGYSRYHLGRSTVDSGAEEFKSRWHSERRQLYWYSWSADGHAAERIEVDSPKYRLAIRTWKRLPLPVTRYFGPRFARGIP